jgi:hypothetical protein
VLELWAEGDCTIDCNISVKLLPADALLCAELTLIFPEPAMAIWGTISCLARTISK